MNFFKKYQTENPFNLGTAKFQSPWWVKLTTARPYCVYYFGPFESQSEARESQSGYIEDLIAEQATGINIEIKQERPKVLTISQ